MRLVPFLQLETWVRHQLSDKEIMETLHHFSCRELWSMGVLENIKISNSAIKPSEESKTSFIFSCKSVIMAKILKLSLGELKRLGLGRGTKGPSEEHARDYGAADHFASLHIPRCPVHPLAARSDLSTIGCSLVDNANIHLAEKMPKFMNKQQRKLGLGASDGILVKQEGVPPEQKCGADSVRSTVIQPPRRPADPEGAWLPERREGWRVRQDAAVAAILSMWRNAMAIWNQVMVARVFLWRGVLVAPLCRNESFVRCCRVVPATNFARNQVDHPAPLQPEVEMPVMVAWKDAPPDGCQQETSQEKEDIVWMVALEETFYFYFGAEGELFQEHGTESPNNRSPIETPVPARTPAHAPRQPPKKTKKKKSNKTKTPK